METFLFYTSFPNTGKGLAISARGNENTDHAVNIKPQKQFVLLHCALV